MFAMHTVHNLARHKRAGGICSIPLIQNMFIGEIKVRECAWVILRVQKLQKRIKAST